jgi:hypothetical protein
MRFNIHSQLAGKHAFLSASKGSWVNYDDDKLDRVFQANMAAQRGTDLHDLANRCVRLGQKLPEDPVTTMGLYVNDAIGFRMTTELTLFYSPNFFATTDAICCRNNKLRIHDLKTGSLRVSSPRQLEIYAALFCLEYQFKPHSLEIELRIYQNDACDIYEANPDDITYIMEKAVAFDARINEIREDA